MQKLLPSQRELQLQTWSYGSVENEDQSTEHPNLENEAPKTRKQSTLDRKQRPLNLENEAP